MTRREIATLACKILAVWVLAEATLFIEGGVLAGILLVIRGFSDHRFEWQEFLGTAATGIPAVGLILVGLILWFKSARIAARMVSDDATPVTRPDIVQADIMAIAFSAIGVYLLVPVVRDLANMLIRIIRNKFPFSEWWASPDWQASFWSNIIGLVFAIWLILGSRGIVRVVLWARSYRGHEQTDSLPPQVKEATPEPKRPDEQTDNSPPPVKEPTPEPKRPDDWRFSS